MSASAKMQNRGDRMPAKLTGVENILQQLNQTASQIDGQVKQEATKAGAEIYREAMAKQAPRSTHNGEHLADNIIITETKTGYAIGPTSKFYYAHFLEWGTSKMTPRPFAAPVFENNRAVVERTMSSILKRRLGL